MTDFIFDLQRFEGLNIDNNTQDTLIQGTDEADSISNGAKNVTIAAGLGDDSISNRGATVTIDAGDGDDSITNSGTNVSIDAGEGNDSISNWGANVTIDAGEGNNYVKNGDVYYDGPVSIRAGSGNDTINIEQGKNVNVDAGDGDNSIMASTSNSSDVAKEISIVSGAGNDYFNVSGGANSTISISAGEGSDTLTIERYNNGNIIADMGDGDDSVANIYSNTTIIGGAGNDSFDLYSSNVENVSIDAGDDDDNLYGYNATLQSSTLNTGAGNDSLMLQSGNSKDLSINLGADNDYFYAGGTLESATIDGGDGDDKIDGGEYGGNGTPLKNLSVMSGNGADSISFSGVDGMTLDGGAGNDSIYVNFSSNISIDGGAGNDTIYSGASHATVHGGDGNDKLTMSAPSYGGATEDAKAFGGAGNDTLVATGDGTTLDGEADDDYLVNYNTKTMMIGGTGNDTLRNEVEGNYTANKPQHDSTLDAGDGNDTLYNGNYKNVSMSGGAGDDSITNNGEKATIDAGAGDDYISLGSTALDNLILYDADDGSDTIEGFNSSSTLSVSGADEILTVKSGSDVIVTVDDKTILLKGAANVSTIHIAGDGFNPNKIIGTDDKNSIDTAIDDATIQAKGDDDTVNVFGQKASIDAGDGADNIHNAGADATIVGGTGNDFVTLATSATGNLIVYNPGDGTDTVSGFNETSTLQIGDGETDTYMRSTVNGNDILISFRPEGSVLLIGAANLSTVNIAGREVDSLHFMYTDDAETIDNTIQGATIEALGGNDSIHNLRYDNVSINAGDGDDTIVNGRYDYQDGKSSTIDGGAGNDSIVNYADSVSIDAGDGNNKIKNDRGDNVTITAGDGNNTIDSRNSATIVTGDGDDSIYNYIPVSGNVSIDAGNGNNRIFASGGDNLAVVTGDGNDNIHAAGTQVTVNAGAGNDTIDVGNGKNLILYAVGDGNDTISGLNATSTIKIGDGTATYSTLQSYTNIILTVGDNTVKLANVSAVNIEGTEVIQTFVSLTDRDDTYTNNHEDVTVSALGGNDKITNNGANASISGGDGNDTLINAGDGATIFGDAGKDSIVNTAANAVIYGDDLSGGSIYDDKNTINNTGDNVLIHGSRGYDTIINEGSNVTIEPVDYDTISLSSSAVGNTIVYKPNAYDSTVEGFNEDDTLQIGDGTATYSVKSDANDVTVKVSEYRQVILKDAATLSQLNIAGDEYNSLHVKLTDNADIYTNNAANVTVFARGGNDSIVNYGANVVIDGSAGNDTLINMPTATNSTLLGGDGNDFIQNGAERSVTIDGGDGNDTLVTSALYASVFGGDGDDVISLTGSSNVTTTLNGGKGNDTIYAKYNSRDSQILFEYSAGDGNDEIHNFNDGDTLKIGDGETSTYYTTTDGDDVVVHAGDGSVTLKGAATLSNVNILGEYSNPFLVTGTDEDDTINNTLDGATITALGGNDSIVNTGDNVSIDAGDGADSIFSGKYNSDTGSNVTIDAGDGDDKIFIYSGDSVSISGGDGNDTIINFGNSVTIDTGADDDIIINDGANVTVDAGDGNDGISNMSANVTINAGDGDDTVINRGENVTINGGGGDDSISLAASATDNLILYSDGDGDDTVEGFNATSTLKIGNGTDTYSYTVDGDDITVTVGEGSILLKGAATLDNVNILGTSKTIAGTDGDDSINATIDGATILTGTGNDTITVGEGVTSLTVSDFAAGDVIKLNATVESISVEENSLVAGDVTIGGIGTVSNEDLALTIGDGTATYSKTFTDGAKLSDDGKTITFVDAGSETLFTIDGLNSDATDDDLNVNGNKVILSAAALNQTTVTLTTTGDYELELADDCPTVTDVAKAWTLEGTTATLIDAGTTEGYALTNANKTVTYAAEVVGETLLTVTGVAENLDADELNANEYLTLNGKILTVKANAVGDNFAVPEGYKIVFAEGMYDGSSYVGTDGKDSVEVHGTGLSLDLGAGNDSVTSNVDGGGNIYLFGADRGKDTVTGYGDGDTIKIVDDSTVTASVKGNDVVVKAGTSTMTLKNAANGTNVKIVDAAGSTVLERIFYTDRIVDGDWVILNANYGSRTYVTESDFPNVNATAVTRKLTLTGGADDNEIVGGKGADFINGGGGHNTLTGGVGADTFAYGGGNDTITDYGTGADKISLGTELSAYEVDDDGNLILKVNGGSVTILDGSGEKITFLDGGRSTTEIFTAAGILNTTKTAITLDAETNDFDATSTVFNKLVTIDGSATDAVSIVGNAKNNVINGGDGSDTLNGNAGNDSLTGGDGADVFIFDGGKDVVTDYVSGTDKISLGAEVTNESVNNRGDVVLKFGTNSLTIKNVGDSSDGRAITFTGDGGDTVKTYFSEKIVANDGVTLMSNFTGTYAATATNPKVDASAVSKKITLTGGDEANEIIGGKGADIIDGGGGDNILIGGKGGDTFVSDGGNDTIGDYGTGSDRISLTSAIKNFDLRGDDVIIGFGNNSLTVADALGDKITFVEGGKTRVNIFAAEGILDSNKTAVTLNATATEFDAADYSKIVTISGALVTGEVEIVGNAKSNKIYAGDNGSTLDGGRGNDSLWGGDGSDTFIYESGKDVIYGFGDDDALQLGGDFTASVSGNSIAFKVGTTSKAVTLKDFTATTFSVNGESYEISNGNFTRK